MQGKLNSADWKRIEDGLKASIQLDNLSPKQVHEFEATLDRIQLHNKTGPYARKLVR